jgi:hypothetical protein
LLQLAACWLWNFSDLKAFLFTGDKQSMFDIVDTWLIAGGCQRQTNLLQSVSHRRSSRRMQTIELDCSCLCICCEKMIGQRELMNQAQATFIQYSYKDNLCSVMRSG